MNAPAFLQLAGVTRRFVAPLPFAERLLRRLAGKNAVPTIVHALENVSLAIPRGKTLGLVGESGCGKSTLGRVAAGILAPNAGEAWLDGAPVMQAGRKRTTKIQMVFQDPFGSLDPRMRVGDLVAEGPIAHGFVSRSESRADCLRWLEAVGLDAGAADRFPHEFSGGQRQRIAIARALAMRPDCLVCDEPVASLDVSIQAQIINLFLRLRADFGLTMLFISHDLSVIRHLSDEIAVMYLGRIVESGPTEAVFAGPRHPYTRALLDSVPRLTLEPGGGEIQPIAGELPSPIDPPPGCAFHQRCPRASALCAQEMPVLETIGQSRALACHHPIATEAVANA